MKVLLARLDSVGDVVLAGPAVAALTEAGHEVDVLCSRIGRPAARLLVGAGDTIVLDAPWILSPAPHYDDAAIERVVHDLAWRGYGAAAILTSSHQSALPTAVLLRRAGIPVLSGISHDYAGGLLDHCVRGDPDVHEVRRNLMVAGALGAPTADRQLALREAGATPVRSDRVVVHPGASAPARTLPAHRWAGVVTELARHHPDVIVTGSDGEAALCRAVVGDSGARARLFAPHDLAGLADTLSSASAVVVGNTGPMHVAAAVGRPVVAVFAPTVPADRWRPWMVPHVLLGQQDVECAGCRARTCPLVHQHCLDPATPAVVRAALEHFASIGPRHEVAA